MILRIIEGFYVILKDFSKLSKILINSKGLKVIYMILRDFTGFKGIFRDFQGFQMISRDLKGFQKNFKGF